MLGLIFHKFSFKDQLQQVMKHLFLIWEPKRNIRSKTVARMLYVAVTLMVHVSVIKIFGLNLKMDTMVTEEEMERNTSSSQPCPMFSKIYHLRLKALKHML